MINDDTLAYQGGAYFAVGGFDWNLQVIDIITIIIIIIKTITITITITIMMFSSTGTHYLSTNGREELTLGNPHIVLLWLVDSFPLIRM